MFAKENQDGEMRNVGIRYANGETERRSYSFDNRLEMETAASGIPAPTNREHTEVLMELNINGIMDKSC